MGVEIISTYSKRRNKLELIMNSISPIEYFNNKFLSKTRRREKNFSCVRARKTRRNTEKIYNLLTSSITQALYTWKFLYVSCIILNKLGSQHTTNANQLIIFQNDNIYGTNVEFKFNQKDINLWLKKGGREIDELLWQVWNVTWIKLRCGIFFSIPSN